VINSESAEADFRSEKALEASIRRRIGENRYELWFHQHTKFLFKNDQLVVMVPNLHFQEWLQTTFASDVREAVAEVIGTPMAVRFVIDVAAFQTTVPEPVPAPTQRIRASAGKSENTALMSKCSASRMGASLS